MSTLSSNTRCEWTLGSDTSTVLISFDPIFGIEQAANCAYDVMELFEAQTSVGRFCGDGGDAIREAFSLNGPVRIGPGSEKIPSNSTQTKIGSKAF